MYIYKPWTISGAFCLPFYFITQNSEYLIKLHIFIKTKCLHKILQQISLTTSNFYYFHVLISLDLTKCSCYNALVIT